MNETKKRKIINTLQPTVKQISTVETYAVRQPILRPGLPIDTCIFNGDQLKTTIHLGVFTNNHLVGVCSLFKNSNPDIAEIEQYQLRGMAVLTAHQHKGYGKLLLNYSEVLLKQQNTTLIWCNAREIATKFYNKIGYQIIGTPFNIKNIGAHYVMYKTL